MEKDTEQDIIDHDFEKAIAALTTERIGSALSLALSDAANPIEDIVRISRVNQARIQSIANGTAKNVTVSELMRIAMGMQMHLQLEFLNMD